MSSGPFESQLHAFVADPGLREIVITIRGEAQSVGTEVK
jgi:hypothetical protein